MLKSLFYLFFYLIYSSLVFAEFELKSFKVGNGNFVVIRSLIGDVYEYMVVDCGVGDYLKSWRVEEEVAPAEIKDLEGEVKGKISEDDEDEKILEDEDEEKISEDEDEEKTKNKKPRRSDVGAFMSKGNMEADWGSKLTRTDIMALLMQDIIGKRSSGIKGFIDSSKSRIIDGKIVIKSLFITHPDKDHLNWAHKIFPAKKFIIENIVLGGSPEKYIGKSLVGLRKGQKFEYWLVKHHKYMRNKIYFMALEGFDLDNFMPDDSIKDKFNAIKNGEYQLAPSMFSIPGKNILIYPTDSSKNIEDLRFLNFGENTRVSLLSVNPRNEISLKSAAEDPKVLQYRVSSADNADSLIIKIENTISNKSAILMGDATAVTTQKVLNNYSIFDKDELNKFLETDVLLASHHGADSEGSNNLEWINVLKPEYFLLSTGMLYGHPTARTYKVLRHSPRLKKNVNGHKIILGENKINYRPGYTYKGIFSTLSNGHLGAIFKDKKLDKESDKSDKDELQVYCDVYSASNRERKIISIISTDKSEKKTTTKNDSLNWVTSKFKRNIPDDLLNKEFSMALGFIAEAKEIELDLGDESTSFIVDYINYRENTGSDEDEIIELAESTIGNSSAKVTIKFYKEEKETKFKPSIITIDGKDSLFVDFNDPRNKPIMRHIIDQKDKYISFFNDIVAYIPTNNTYKSDDLNVAHEDGNIIVYGIEEGSEVVIPKVSFSVANQRHVNNIIKYIEQGKLKPASESKKEELLDKKYSVRNLRKFLKLLLEEKRLSHGEIAEETGNIYQAAAVGQIVEGYWSNLSRGKELWSALRKKFGS